MFVQNVFNVKNGTCHINKIILCYAIKALVILTVLRDLRRRWTSTISATISNLATDDRRALDARTMAPRFIDEHGSSANSCDADFIVSPEITQIHFRIISHKQYASAWGNNMSGTSMFFIPEIWAFWSYLQSLRNSSSLDIFHVKDFY